MRIGNAFKENRIQSKSSQNTEVRPSGKNTSKYGPSIKAFEPRENEKISGMEIRQKLESYRLKNSAKSKKESPEIKAERPKEIELVEVVNPDVGLNNPDDPIVQEKLKGILKSGAFKFDAKTQQVLSGILNK